MGLLLTLWFAFAVVMAMIAVHWQAKREKAHRRMAYDEILSERGVQRAPGESIKGALVRARAEESLRPMRAASIAPPSMRLPAPSRSGFEQELASAKSSYRPHS